MGYIENFELWYNDPDATDELRAELDLLRADDKQMREAFSIPTGMASTLARPLKVSFVTRSGSMGTLGAKQVACSASSAAKFRRPSNALSAS